MAGISTISAMPGKRRASDRRWCMKTVRRAIAFIFIVVTFRLPWPCWDRHARLDGPLLRGLVEADRGAVRIMRSLIDLEHIFHGGDEPRVGFWRYDESLSQMRFEKSRRQIAGSGRGASTSRCNQASTSSCGMLGPSSASWQDRRRISLRKSACGVRSFGPSARQA